VVEAEPLAVDQFVEKVVAVAEVLTGRVIAELVVVAAVEKIESAYVEEMAEVVGVTRTESGPAISAVVVAAVVVMIVASLSVVVVAAGELAGRSLVDDAVASVACAASVPDTADDAAASL